MELTNLEAARVLGAEYGWDDRKIEMALGYAIHLTYCELDMLVEVDVDLDEGVVTARRRNGIGDRGAWIDIQKPLLPTAKLFREVMEYQEWGDGAPGRVMEGIVSGFRDGGIIYRVFEKMVYVPENLLSVSDFHNKPPLGTMQVMALCASTDNVSNMRMGTRRGREFVASVMESYYPDCISGIWMGASNSWAVIRMKPEHMSAWLEQGGVNIKHLQQVLGLRRITLLPEGKGENTQDCRDNEIKHFINNAWKACRIAVMEPDRVVLHVPLDVEDPRKIRTFTSMFQKIAPERELVLM